MPQTIKISQTSVVRILYSQKSFPDHIQLHEELQGTKFQNRIKVCERLLNKTNTNDTFLQNILSTDEAIMTNFGQVIIKNMHYNYIR